MQQRLMSSNMTTEDVNRDINMIVYTTDLERETVSKSSYLDCFKGRDLQRTLVVIGAKSGFFSNRSGQIYRVASTDTKVLSLSSS